MKHSIVVGLIAIGGLILLATVGVTFVQYDQLKTAPPKGSCDPTAAGSYTIRRIDVPGSPWVFSTAQSVFINESNNVAGNLTINAEMVPFFYQYADDTATLLPHLDPNLDYLTTQVDGLNDYDQLVGTSRYSTPTLTNAYRAVLFEDGAVAPIDLSNATDPEVNVAHGINNEGVVTGYTASRGRWGFRLTGDKVEEFLAPAGEKPFPSDINNEGAVVGWADILPGVDDIYQAFLFEGGSQIHILGALHKGVTSWATDINDPGLIVGWSEIGEGTTRTKPVYWGDREIEQLATLEENPHGRALGVNNHSAIVGSVFPDASSAHPVGVMWPRLNSAPLDVLSLLQSPEGWTKLQPHSINDKYCIAGMGNHDIPDNGVPNAFFVMCSEECEE